MEKTLYKPCPFCMNPNAIETDTGDACCFCDYEGVVGVGKYGVFVNIQQYNKIFFASNHKDRIDNLHGKNDEQIFELKS